MGSVISGIFGGTSYSAPSAPSYDPIPARESEAEPESAAVRDAERRKLRARRGLSGTLLTSPLGVNGLTAGASGASGTAGLLGRNG